MALNSDMRGGLGTPPPPAAFTEAVEELRAAVFRPEVAVESMPAPQRIAPFSAAVSADVTLDEDEVGTGRLILLHNPAGNEAWQGDFRFVAYARAHIDPEVASDPMLGAVGWSWLEEALDAHGAAWGNASGTITRVTTESFGAMEDEESTAQIEIRASWTPETSDDGHTPVQAHVEAWGELLCTAVGMPPVPDGVTAIPSRRGQRGH